MAATTSIRISFQKLSHAVSIPITSLRGSYHHTGGITMKQNQKDSLTIMYWGIAGLAADALFEARLHEPVWAVGSAIVAAFGFVWARVLAARTPKED